MNALVFDFWSPCLRNPGTPLTPPPGVWDTWIVDESVITGVKRIFDECRRLITPAPTSEANRGRMGERVLGVLRRWPPGDVPSHPAISYMLTVCR